MADDCNVTEMTPAERLFFQGHGDALPLYERLREVIFQHCTQVSVEVKKTQISFRSRYLFAAASFLPVRPAQERPASYLTVTFSLPYRLDSPRIDAAVIVSAKRWTHHMLLSQVQQIDEQLCQWLVQAADFSRIGRR